MPYKKKFYKKGRIKKYYKKQCYKKKLLILFKKHIQLPLAIFLFPASWIVKMETSVPTVVVTIIPLTTEPTNPRWMLDNGWIYKKNLHNCLQFEYKVIFDVFAYWTKVRIFQEIKWILFVNREVPMRPAK